MEAKDFILLVLQASIFAQVFCLALGASKGDLAYVLRRPGLLVRSVLAMNVVMPILAAVIAAVCNLRHELKVALILLAVAPVPPLLPLKQRKADGNISYAVGLLMLSALVAVVVIPITIAMIGRGFGRTLDVPMTLIAGVVATSTIAPLLAGGAVRLLAPSFAARAAKPVATVSLVLLVLAFIPIVFLSWRPVAAQIGDFTVVAIILFVLTGLGVGHLMGGPDPDDRTILALSTANRHPGVAIAIAGAVAQNAGVVAAMVLLAVTVGAIVTTLYLKWRQKRREVGALAA